MPLHVTIQPDRERASGLEGGVVIFPVGGAVLGGSGLGHGCASLQTRDVCATTPSDSERCQHGYPYDSIDLVENFSGNHHHGPVLLLQ